MKITDITYEIYNIPYNKEVSSGRGTYRGVVHSYVKVYTDGGLIGIGSSRNMNGVNLMKPLLIGEDPLCTERLFDKMCRGILKGHQYIQAISAIDIALWDIKAKAAGMPLYKLLGGARNKVKGYVAGGYYARNKTNADLQKEMEHFVEMGFRAVKMKIGALSPKEDADRVKAVREAVGDNCDILMDAGGAYKFHEAIEFAKRVEPYFPTFFEEPCAATDIKGFIKVYEHTSLPLAAGEEAMWKYGARDLIDSGSISYIQPDATLCGGITDFLKTGAYADMNHIYISPHGIQQLHTHLSCAMHNATLTEFYINHHGDYYADPVKVDSEGMLSPSETPGNSLEYIPEALKEFRIG